MMQHHHAIGSDELAAEESIDSSAQRPWLTAQRWFIAGIIALVALALIFAQAMQKAVNHDENQFIASGVLLARRGMLPYKDYAYFHLPNLVFIYALLFKASSKLLWITRTFSTLCASATIFFIVNYALTKLSGLGRWRSVGVALCLITMLVCSTSYWHGVGLAWNHDASIMLAVLAVLAAAHAVRRRSSLLWVASGALISLACGTRLTLAPVGLLLGLAVILAPHGSARQRIVSILGFFAAGVIAMAPTFYCLSIAPKEFWWGNVGYRMYPVPGAAKFAWYDRIWVFGTRVLADTPSALLMGGLIVLCGACWGTLKRMNPLGRYERLLLVGSAAAAFLGGALPAPVFVQYFYACIPFVVLAIAALIGTLPVRAFTAPALKWILWVMTVLSVLTGMRGYETIARSLWRENWYPLHVHELGLTIAKQAKGRMIVTLSPLLPLEGGARIYPAFATGPFQYRVAPLTPISVQREQRLVGLGSVKRMLRSDRNYMLLTGWEAGLETKLIKEAEYDQLGNVVIEAPITLWGRSLPAPKTPTVQTPAPAPEDSDEQTPVDFPDAE
jgi:hypothetical protein